MTVFGGGLRYAQTILKLSFCTTEMEAYANKFLYARSQQKYRNAYWVDIIYLILYEINNYLYNVFDVSLADENNGCSLIWGHLRRV